MKIINIFLVFFFFIACESPKPIKKASEDRPLHVDTSNQEVYSFMKTVILEEEFRLSNGLQIIPVAEEISEEERKFFLEKDMDYILSQREKCKDFKWNNERLGFNLANDSNWYCFSVPVFSVDQNTAMVKVRDLCKPFLCGSSYILIFTKENDKWNSKKIGQAIH